MMISGRCLAIARLAAQQVEVLRRRREVRDADVALGGELQEALQARAGVLGARALVAVRQQQRQARGLAPLGQAGDDELVDDDLGAVDEVAELRLPEHERLGRLRRVAVLEARGSAISLSGELCSSNGASAPGRFWIGQIVWPVLASCRTRWRWENVPRSTSWPVRRTGVPSVSSEAKASDSACAQSMPPSAPSASRRRSSCLTSLGWTVKPSGVRSSSSLSDAQPVGRHGGLDLGRRRAVELCTRRSCCSTVPASSAALMLRLEVLVQARQVVPDLLLLGLDLLARDHALLDELLGAQLGDALLALDRRVHLGLRVRGLVGLVVAEAAVADQVDDDVVAELLAEGEGEAHGADAGGDVVGVDVDDRRRRSPWRGPRPSASSARPRGRS